MQKKKWNASLLAAAMLWMAALPLHAAEFAQQAQRLVEQTYAADAPGAVVLVARGDEVLLRMARGRAVGTSGRPLTPDDRSHLGSLTKQMAAAGLLKLVEAGKVSLDDPLSKYVPDFAGGERVPIALLLNHTSGISGLPDMARVPAGVLPLQATTDALVDVFKHQPPAYAPGARFAYNDSGYILVAKIIESASGKPWHEYLAETLFRPLGMTGTCYCPDAPRPSGHTTQGGQVKPSAPPNVTWENAAGALVSTVDDMHKWNRALHEGRVLKPATYQRMVEPHAASGNYGFGIDHAPLRNHEQLAHGGSVIGYAAHLLYLPGPDVTVAVLRNFNDGGEYAAAGALARKLALMALGEPADLK